MYDNGQRRISFVIWYQNGSGVSNQPSHVVCQSLLTDGAKLYAQHENNLRDFLLAMVNQGFEQINIRFAPSGTDNDPKAWATLDPVKLEYHWNFMVGIRAKAYEAISSSSKRPKLIFDLGSELAAAWVPDNHVKNRAVTRQYIKEIWSRYAQAFQTSDTIGFSLVPASFDMVFAQIELYREVGRGYPSELGFDIYRVNQDSQTIHDQLTRVADALERFSLAKHPIFLQETNWNSAEIKSAFQQLAKNRGVQFRYVMQWPIKDTSPLTPANDGSNLDIFDQYRSLGGLYRQNQGVYYVSENRQYCGYDSWQNFVAMTGKTSVDDVPVGTLPDGLFFMGGAILPINCLEFKIVFFMPTKLDTTAHLQIGRVSLA